MALAVDSSVTAWALTNQASDLSTDGTSGAFVPADGSLLVVISACDTNAGSTPTLNVSGGGLTWTTRVSRGDSEGTAGSVGIATAPVVTGASMTVTVDWTGTGQGTNQIRGRAKVYIVTGQDASPIGSTGENSSTTNNWTPSGFVTTTAANSYVFAGASEWNALGAPEGSSDLTEENWHIASVLSGLWGYKVVASAGSTSINFNAAGTSAADWNAVALEIKEAAGGGGTVRPRSLLLLGCGA